MSHQWFRIVGLPLIAVALLLSACEQDPVYDVPARRSPPVPLPGQLIVHPDNPSWLMYADGRPHFLAAAGDPEDFLYRGTLNQDGTRQGDQIEIIAKLKQSGANGIYFQIIRSHGGDGETTHNPFIGQDPDRGLNFSILDQWDEWMGALDDAGIAIYLFFYDDNASVWNTGDQVSVDERMFFEALVNRFEHHKHIVWIIAEEYQEALSVERVSTLAKIIRAADDHGHAIGVHKLSGLDFDEFADDPNIDQFAIQYNVPTAQELHDGIVEAFRRAGGRYNLNMSEAREHGSGKEARIKNWAIAMAGAYVMVLGMDVANTSMHDLEDLGRLRGFMESVDFVLLAPNDALAHEATQYVLSRPGRSYVLYSSDVDSRGLMGLTNIPSGKYRFRWFDPASGGEEVEVRSVAGGAGSWQIPEAWSGEVVVHIRREGGSLPPEFEPDPRVGPSGAGPSSTAKPESTGVALPNKAPQAADSSITLSSDSDVTLSLTVSDPDGPGPYKFVIVDQPRNGRLTGTGNDLTYIPNPGFSGTDSFTWRASDSVDLSNIATTTIEVQD